MTGVAKTTIVKLLRDLGAACAKYHDERARAEVALYPVR
jgi:hypothetical protein